MREIKFRGRALDSGEWIYGYLILTDDRAYIHPYQNGMDFDDTDFGWGFKQVGPKSVGQFTGLEDKNGTEIYEGDVVYLGGYGNYVVEWPFIQLYGSSFEKDIGSIIGNICANPSMSGF